MKIIDSALANHIQQEVTTLCWCWRIARTDGVILGFTNFDTDLVIGGVRYAAATGFTPSAIATDNTMSVNNLEISSILDAASITPEDLVGGKFDYARVDIFLVNYLDLPTSLNTNPPKHLLLLSGVLGEVKNSDYSFSAEVRSKAQFLSQKSTNLTSKLCRYDLGNAKCTVNLTNYTHNLTVASVVNSRTFTVTNFNQIDNYFDYGNVRFTSGSNNGVKAMVATYTNSTRTITLFEPLPYQLQAGDTLVAIAGCRKTTQDCQSRYSNILNYGGEPHVPGADTYFAGAL
jgi:uncharacterized phage protein (TIGR02218 family)